MRRTANWLAGALALTALGVVDTSGQVVKGDAKQAAMDAWVTKMEGLFGPDVRQVFRSEMHVMRVVCGPTKSQYDKIAADNEAILRPATRTYIRALAGGSADFSETRATFTNAIAKSVRATLGAEQAARYEKDLALRAAARKRVVVANLVATIDGALFLTPDQRDRLRETLAANWNELWDQTVVLAAGALYLPPMPEAIVLPILSDAQRTAWHGIPKLNGKFGGMPAVPHVEVADEVWDDKPAPKSPPAPKAVGKP